MRGRPGIDKSQVRRYAPEGAAVFRIVRERWGGLSNFGAFPLEINGVAIPTPEALYQACRFPAEPELQRLVISQPNPMAAKVEANKKADRTRADWFDINVRLMRWVLRVKLACNYESFGQLLDSTGDQPIVEHSRRDVFWGARYEGRALVGVNALGRLLMELREKYRMDRRGILRKVSPPDIPDFLLYGETIGEVTRRIGDE